MSTIQLSLFVGDRFLVTRSSGHSASSKIVRDALLSGELPATLSPGAIALRLSRVVVDRFFPLLLDIEQRLDSMEDDLIARPTDRLLAELLQQKGDLKRLLRILQYHTQIFTLVRHDPPPQLQGLHHEIVDVHEQLERHQSLARLYYELTGDLMDGYLSLSSHRLNQIMKILTIVTVIFVPITFMAGIYGMNFEVIPELGFEYGYFFLLGAMLLVVSGTLAFFFRKGWLGRDRDRGRGA
jgi:magnesium transporter